MLANNDRSSLSAIIDQISRYIETINQAHRDAEGYAFKELQKLGLTITIEDKAKFIARRDRSIGKEQIHLRREVKVHIANRLQAALWREAAKLSAAKVAIASAEGPCPVCRGTGVVHRNGDSALHADGDPGCVDD